MINSGWLNFNTGITSAQIKGIRILCSLMRNGYTEAFVTGEGLKDYTSKSHFMGIICVQLHDINSLGSLQRNRAARKSWGDYSYSLWSHCRVILLQENHGFLLLQSLESSHLRFWDSVLTSGCYYWDRWIFLACIEGPAISVLHFPGNNPLLSCLWPLLKLQLSQLCGTQGHWPTPSGVSVPFYWLKSALNLVPLVIPRILEPGEEAALTTLSPSFWLISRCAVPCSPLRCSWLHMYHTLLHKLNLESMLLQKIQT